MNEAPILPGTVVRLKSNFGQKMDVTEIREVNLSPQGQAPKMQTRAYCIWFSKRLEMQGTYIPLDCLVLLEGGAR